MHSVFSLRKAGEVGSHAVYPRAAQVLRIPSEGYVRELLETASLKRQISENCADMCEILLAEELSSMNGELLKGAEELEALLARCPTEPAAAETFAKTVLPAMERLRSLADAMERRCPSDRWPFPSYTALLYSVR